MDARELAIQLATRDYNAGTFTSQRAAAKVYGLPQSTLYNRLYSTITSTASY
ncbi:hypothetical protein P154DRAFT_420589 [Amniculicola lignicola CBS 123094]|uniref:HTH psq-type domain-containing protein n=1 Tax=Amniculicola lignicola CBS 123094 TaxID=1392246 RepID=A0A6A5X304_9PLEO|nr:hypothetical protein P154DRAFT_420589 [Amniculicola lignicola CBS 123094]